MPLIRPFYPPPPRSDIPALNNPPDWSDVTRPIVCPSCEYDLRGLSNAVCPECGHHFVWREVIEANLGDHHLSFELRPRVGLGVFFATACRTFTPMRFFETLQLRQRAVPRRLVLYSVIVTLFTLAGLASEWIVYLVNAWRINPAASWQDLLSTQIHLIALGLANVVAPMVVFATLLVFRSFANRPTATAVQIYRAVVYSSDIAIWAAMIAIAWNVGRIAGEIFMWPNSSRHDPLTYWLWLPAGLIFAYRLCAAHQLYLRARSPVAMALGACAVALFVMSIFLIMAFVRI